MVLMQNSLAVEADLKSLLAGARVRESEWLRLAVALAERGAPKQEVDAAYAKALAAAAVKNELVWQLARITGHWVRR
jgi:hypothetical protein